MKIRECKGGGGIGFIDPYVVNDAVLREYPSVTEDNILDFLERQYYCSEILFPYRFK
jgi:hypothetical protein